MGVIGSTFCASEKDVDSTVEARFQREKATTEKRWKEADHLKRFSDQRLASKAYDRNVTVELQCSECGKKVSVLPQRAKRKLITPSMGDVNKANAASESSSKGQLLS